MGDEPTLYQALGGEAVLTAVVEGFYQRVLANPKLAAFFAHTSIDQLKRHQRDFLTLVLGGPERYTGRTMHEAHAGRGITDADFDRLLQHLVDSLAEQHVVDAVIGQIVARVGAFRADIVAG